MVCLDEQASVGYCSKKIMSMYSSKPVQPETSMWTSWPRWTSAESRKHLFRQVSLPANISTSDQRCFNVVDQRWNNVDPTLKMKQNLTSDFQSSTTLIQNRCPTLKEHRSNVAKRRSNVAQCWCNVVSTLFQCSIDIS